MGYWFPPPPSVFSPAPRVLKWHWEGNVRVPDDEDAALFGIGVPEGGLIEAGWNPLVAHMPGAHPGNTGAPRTFQKFHAGKPTGKTDADLLVAYQRLIDISPPGAPASGGLPADYVDQDGTLHLFYWDLADDWIPWVKEVRYKPKADKGVDVNVYTWYPDQQTWGGEGFDFERDFSGALIPILQALNVISTAVISIFATPAVGAAWSAVFGSELKLAEEQRKAALEGGAGPSIGDAFAEIGPALAKFGGAAGAGEILATPMAKDVANAFYKAVGVAQKEGADFADAIGKVVKQAGDVIPKLESISFSDAIDKGVIPQALLDFDRVLIPDPHLFGASDIEHVPGALSFEWRLASLAYPLLANGDKEGFYAWRKLSVMQDIFDAAIASLAATDQKEQEDAAAWAKAHAAQSQYGGVAWQSFMADRAAEQAAIAARGSIAGPAWQSFQKSRAAEFVKGIGGQPAPVKIETTLEHVAVPAGILAAILFFL